MIILEYLIWILFIGYCYFAAIRLKWLYEKVEGHPFWQKPRAKNYHLAAAVLSFVAAAVLLLEFHVVYLLILVLGEYLLIAGPAVKVNERGIMTNAFIVRWPDILRAERNKTSDEISILTKHAWQRVRLQVPAAQFAAFRKILAVNGIRIVELEAEKSGDLTEDVSTTVSENKSHNPSTGVVAEHPA
jgi:hypothetical protein